ncbi:MAG: ATP-binding protein, partial [Chloroflexia bacterium]
MSHELRTPLNSILGFGQLMEMQDPSPDQAESIDHILKSGKHLLNLIDDVLEISHIEANRLTLSLEPVLLDRVIDDAIQLIRISATQRGIHISRGSGEKLFVIADVQRLMQVLLNLLSNAIKYNTERGTILVEYFQRAGGLIRVLVTDSGNGIPADQLPLLFSPFERLGAEQTGVQGTGLGLALSKHLIEAMSGLMGVESECGRGTTFWFDLVETEPHSKKVGETITDVLTHAEPIAQKMTLLCIEDNQANLTLIERIMRRWPLSTLIPAMQGRSGIELAHQHQPDLILLDLHLPDIMGDEVLRELKSDPDTAHIPVIVVSADASQKQIERLLDGGARAYITKPIDVRKFIELVEGIGTEKVAFET